MPAASDPVAEIVRKGAPDRYLAALYAPEGLRPDLLALAAFDVEVSRIRDLVSQALPGEIRLQWWREVVSGERDGEAAANPVAAALLRATARHRLPRPALGAYLDARLFDLYDDPMPDRATLEGYCGEIDAALIQLAVLVVDPAQAPASAEAAGHGGCALGIARILRRLAQTRARGQCFVPGDVLAAVGLDRDAFLAGREAERMGAAVEAMVALGREHLAAFRSHAGPLPATVRPAFLPVATVPAQLSAIDREAWRAPPLDLSAIRRNWVILRHAMRGWRRL